MQSEQRRKRKLKPPFFLFSSFYYCFKCSFLFLFVAFFFFFNGFPSYLPSLFKPILSLSLKSNPSVEDLVLFPDHVLLLVSNPTHKGLVCAYHNNSSSSQITSPVLALDEYNNLQSIARCPLPPANHTSAATGGVHSWERLAYAAVLDGKTVVVFAKGLNLRPDRVANAEQLHCHFNLNGNRIITTNAITSAQEIIRCWLPRRLHTNPRSSLGVRVSISESRRRGRVVNLPSVAKIIDLRSKEPKYPQHELCVCTMLWNQASFLREWIIYHTWLGVERWFVYDNNSDDDIKKTIEQLMEDNYNISRHSWPWIKSQEAGFSHCILQARDQCKWVAFMDVDEFYYFPNTSELVHHPLRSLVMKFTSSKRIGEIRTSCHSFGPSGLLTPPVQGVTTGYTCRLQSPERHKSIVRLRFVDDNLLNVVHHFHLRRGYRYVNLPQNIAVINHYKYQVWETFKAKFSRRVATYVADWQESQNEGSKDRAPGLGTEAVEPVNWRLRFCEVWIQGLGMLLLLTWVILSLGCCLGRNRGSKFNFWS